MTPRTVEQNDAIRKQRIAQIRNTAVEVYLEKGMQMEMGDIARKAGLGRGTVYHYYNNKLHLVEDLLLEAFEEAALVTAKTMQSSEPPLVRLEQYAALQLESWLRQPFGYILFKNWFHSEPIVVYYNDRLLADFHARLYKPVLEAVEEGIRLGQIAAMQPSTTVSVFFAALIGATGTYIGNKDSSSSTNRDEWIRDVTTVLFKGLQA
ncbi:TetR/AcrR family transcriptional regulator [Paenibacillus sp. RC67]|uniref:TetR/AcrR family transcriptional regulator n=1 Tax=Paenibacillus sp. RC67 TaxID=3039392 RepID=UPI0024AE31A6|nr:TetR/AcrR family transcriptional regulator [Paenibacillus sp. RC67]